MRILYIATAYNRYSGDVITPWLVETIRHLAEAGVEVEVLAPSYRGLPTAELDGVKVHRFRYAPRRWEDLTHDQTAPDRIGDRPWYLGLVPGYAISGAISAARLARRGGFDAVHVHWPIPNAVLGLAARRAARIPLVSTFHGVELTWTRRRFPILLPFLRHVIRVSDAVTANSSYTAGMIREVWDRPVERVPFGATVGAGGNEAEGESFGDTAHGAEGAVTAGIGLGAEGSTTAGTRNGFELLFAGRLVERKGVAYLLEALTRVRGSVPVRLRVVGDGPLRASLEAQASELGLGDDVRFDGFVSSEELARRFAECDAFVLPAVWDSKGDTEGLGVVLIEALSHGKPAIGSAAGGIVDIVRDGETGLLVPPADVDALAKAITRLAEDPALARALGEGGREYVAREFSWPVITERLVALYENVVRGAARQG